MTNVKQSSAMGQLNLFDLLAHEKSERGRMATGKLCISVKLMSAVKTAIRTAPKSRETIADEMAHFTGADITIHMINSWIAESHPHRLPAEYVPALCAVTGCTEPIRIIAEASGLYTLAGPDALRAEIQKLDEREKEVAAEKRKHKLLLQALEGERP